MKRCLRCGCISLLILTAILQPAFSMPINLYNNGQPGQQNEKPTEDHQKLPITERWYQTLQNDQAGVEQWLSAAHNITAPIIKKPDLSSNRFSTWIRIDLRRQQQPELLGTVLRSKQNPTVSKLLQSRFDAVLQQNVISSPIPPLYQLLNLASYLAVWDRQAAIPALRDLNIKLLDHFKSSKTKNSLFTGLELLSNSRSTYAMAICSLTQLRSDIGDEKAIDEYVTWLRQISTEDLLDAVDSYPAVIVLLTRYPDRTSVKTAMNWLFLGQEENSPTDKLFDPGNSYNILEELLNSPFLNNSAFQKMLINRLNNQTEIGYCEVEGKNQNRHLACSIGERQKINYPLDENEDEDEPEALKPNNREMVRIADLFAQELAKLKDVPAFQLYWPKDQRDNAIAEIKNSLLADRIHYQIEN